MKECGNDGRLSGPSECKCALGKSARVILDALVASAPLGDEDDFFF